MKEIYTNKNKIKKGGKAKRHRKETSFGKFFRREKDENKIKLNIIML